MKSDDSASPARDWPVWAKVLVSVLLVLHLTAVFMPPFTFQASPIRGVGSPLAETAMNLVQPYVDAAYLNHGYAFFAPDPGPSHLLRAEIEFADGRPPLVEVMPDLDRHWPRLLYHRHFMLCEHLHASFAPPEPPPNPEDREAWSRVRDLYERRWAAYENHLKTRHGAERVKLTRLEHVLLDPYEFSVRGRLPEAEDTYLELREIVPPDERFPGELFPGERRFMGPVPIEEPVPLGGRPPLRPGPLFFDPDARERSGFPGWPGAPMIAPPLDEPAAGGTQP